MLHSSDLLALSLAQPENRVTNEYVKSKKSLFDGHFVKKYLLLHLLQLMVLCLCLKYSVLKHRAQEH